MQWETNDPPGRIRGRLQDGSSVDLSIAELWGLYEQENSVHRVGRLIGRNGDTVHRRLIKAGYKLNNSVWRPEEISLLKQHFRKGVAVDALQLAKRLGRSRVAVQLKASKLGLGDKNRPFCEIARRHISEGQLRHFREHGNPRLGKPGKPLPDERKKQISLFSKNMWAEWKRTGTGQCSPESRARRAVAMSKLENAKRRGHSNVSAGERPDLGNVYFRSSWDANIARYLNLLQQCGEVRSWGYETRTFQFHNATVKPFTYTPDFEVVTPSGDTEYWEVKGWKDKKWEHKLALFRKTYPEERLRVINQREYLSIEKQFSFKVDAWEHSHNVASGIIPFSRIGYCLHCNKVVRHVKFPVKYCSSWCRRIAKIATPASCHELYDALLEKNPVDVGIRYAVSGNMITKWAKAYGLDLRAIYLSRMKALGDQMPQRIGRKRSGPKHDLSGQRFGRWSVLEHTRKDGHSQVYWRCKCSCGRESLVIGKDLASGKSRSCRSCSMKTRWMMRKAVLRDDDILHNNGTWTVLPAKVGDYAEATVTLITDEDR